MILTAPMSFVEKNHVSARFVDLFELFVAFLSRFLFPLAVTVLDYTEFTW